jgi:hypothetical protein
VHFDLTSRPPIAQLTGSAFAIGFLEKEIELSTRCVGFHLLVPRGVVLFSNKLCQFGQFFRRKLAYRALNFGETHIGEEFYQKRFAMARAPSRAREARTLPSITVLANRSARGRDSAPRDDTMRKMEADDWMSLSDQDLLERRISTLGLRLDGTMVEPLIRQLYDELSAKGLTFHPPCHIGDEWFVPIGIPAIFIPFYLVHDRLRALERTMMLEVEGETPEWFMKLMRHEAAHAYSYGFQLQRKKKWQQTFGQTSDEETPSLYRPRPFSRSYVVHLDDWYAQAHPDEDFAETFAIWLTPGLDWRMRYAGWKALQKLEYVDELMRSLAGQPQVQTPKYRATDYNCLNVKLKTYYARKRKFYEDLYPDFYDVDLRQLFAAPAGPGRIKASSYLRQRRRRLMNSVCQWTNERKYRVNKLLTRLIERCDQLGLHVHNDDPQINFRAAAFITTLVMNYLFTGKFKRTK